VQRKIADRRHNRFVAEGVGEHTPTQIVPASILRPLSEESARALDERHRETERFLARSLGKPAYSRGGLILYCGDACRYLEVLSREGFEVDLSLTSPPYNIGKEYEEPMTVADYVAWCSKWMTQIHAATKRSGAFWLNVGYVEVPEQGLCVPIPYLLWNASPFYLLQEVVWKYGAGVSAKRRLSPRNEKWLFFVSDPDRYTFNLDDIRDPNVKYPNQKKKGKYRCNPLGKNPSDVWEFPKVTTGANRSSKERTSHPAQFPIPVVERVIRACSNPVDLVMDPFAGSCSAGIAAIGLGRLFLGFEIRQDYCHVAIERFESFLAKRQGLQQQRTLF